MRNELLALEKLVEDLRKENVLESEDFGDDIIKLKTSKFLIIIYLPNSNRLEINEDIKVIHLDIDVLNNSYSKVLQRIKGLLGKGNRIYARETVVARIDKKVTLEFLEENHLNGPMAGKYRYGLFYKGELVSAAIFSGGRIMHDISEDYRSFELVRFCHKADCLVVGGISKLVKAFIEDFKPNDIMTYADRDWSQESSLNKIGFVEEGMIDPLLFYIKNGARLTFLDSRENYQYIVKNTGSIKLKLYL